MVADRLTTFRHPTAWVLLAAGLLAAVAGAAARPLAAEDGGGEGEKLPGGGKERHVVRRHKFDEFGLPADFKNEDGTFNQEALVAQQKSRLPRINKELAARFRLAETKHFLIFSDADKKITRTFAAWAEGLYDNLKRQFAIGPEERVWDGKCILVVFNYRATFLEYAREFDGFDAARAGAYFAPDVYAEGDPELVHICIPLGHREDLRRLQELFAHEGTHAFFELYKERGHLPLWLHEGLAEFMTVVNDPKLARRKRRFAIRIAKAGSRLKPLLERPIQAGLSYPEYNVSYTLVDFMVRASKQEFRDFVIALKNGKTQGEALEATYGWSMDELERRWRIYASKILPKRR